MGNYCFSSFSFKISRKPKLPLPQQTIPKDQIDGFTTVEHRPKIAQVFQEAKESKESKDQKKRLKETNYDELKLFSLQGQNHWCKVTRVIDGDTVELVHFVHSQERKDIVRLFGFDAPEKRPKKSLPYCELEKKAAKVVTEILKQLLQDSDHMVWGKFQKAEKYGRQLADLYVEEGKEDKKLISIQEWMIDHKLVKPYFGKTKEEWKEEELKNILRFEYPKKNSNIVKTDWI